MPKTVHEANREAEGWCEECEMRSVRSGVVLAGLI
jgi:hypothetical protein